MNKIYTKLSAFILVTSLFLFGFSASAQTVQSTNTALPGNGDPNYIVCYALAGVLPCTPPRSTATTTTGSTSTATQTTTSTGSTSFLGRLLGLGGSSSATRNMSANISQGFQGKTQKNLAVILVKSSESSEIYRVIGGKKFLIPNDKVFESYGYVTSDIVTMSQDKIDLYPRIRLLKFEGDADIYYLTESGLTRKVINEVVFNSYADRNQDVVIINKTEFSLYPQNIYVYNENIQVVNRRPNVYLLGDGTKKLIFSDELDRLGVTDAMVAPVNQLEFDAYQNVLVETLKQKLWYNIF